MSIEEAVARAYGGGLTAGKLKDVQRANMLLGDIGETLRLAAEGRLAELAAIAPAKVMLADSRERIGLFDKVMLKPNERECLAAANGATDVDTAST